MKRIILLAAAIAVLAAAPARADTQPAGVSADTAFCAADHASGAHRWLSRRVARRCGYNFAASTVDLLDVNRRVYTFMVPPSDCARLDRVTVACHFAAYLAGTGKTFRGRLRVHLQRDGLLGFLLPAGYLKYEVPAEQTFVVSPEAAG